MKKIATILFLIISINASGQLIADNNWPVTVKKEFSNIKESGVDTIYSYYEYLGPWTSLPDSCHNIPAIWFFWGKNGKCYSRYINCTNDSIKTNILTNPLPIQLFLKHIKDFENRRLSKNIVLELPSDESMEYFIFMTTKKQIRLSISDFQRKDTNWKRSTWINPTIQVIDSTKRLIEINNVR